ncbi:hypothetical protein [Escherichia coli]|uniref:hypothetical protein n=1 Tax=Escherichia coli TaxID=562 RepID=UPI003B99CD05
MEGTLIHDFERWAKRQPFDFSGGHQNKKTPLSQTLLPYIRLNYPEWVDVRDGRKNLGSTFGISPKGIRNIELNKSNIIKSSNKSASRKAIDWNQFRDELWGVESTSSNGNDVDLVTNLISATSTKDDVFCFDQKSRNVLQGMGDGRKYAHAKGVELTFFYLDTV